MTSWACSSPACSGVSVPAAILRLGTRWGVSIASLFTGYQAFSSFGATLVPAGKSIIHRRVGPTGRSASPSGPKSSTISDSSPSGQSNAFSPAINQNPMVTIREPFGRLVKLIRMVFGPTFGSSRLPKTASQGSGMMFFFSIAAVGGGGRTRPALGDSLRIVHRCIIHNLSV